MAVISNRAITLSDSLKNTVDTQDSCKQDTDVLNNVIQYLCVLNTIEVARKKWTRGKEKGEKCRFEFVATIALVLWSM